MANRPTLEAWQTGITLIRPNEIHYRGVPIDEIIQASRVYALLIKRLAT